MERVLGRWLVGSWRYARTAVIEPVNGNGFWITIERFHVLSLVERSKMLGVEDVCSDTPSVSQV
jgi:hypothetical protein